MAGSAASRVPMRAHSEAVHEFTGTKVAVKIINRKKMKTKKMSAKVRQLPTSDEA